MPKKDWTPEERAAFGEKMRQAKLNKQTGSQFPPKEEVDKSEPVDPGPTKTPDYESMMRMVLELQRAFINQQAATGGQTVSPTGSLVGTQERYVLDPDYYADPTERLRNEPRLQRFAFKDNYEIKYKCYPTRRYETIDHRWVQEPQFDLDLIRIMYDEATGVPTNGRYTVCRGVFFEDPETAVVVARDNGLEVDETNQRQFLDEMRYIRMRDWLLEAFYPALPQVVKNKKEMVIGGKLVDYFEVNSEDSETVPFSQLKSKI
jgi:hypothetical protein